MESGLWDEIKFRVIGYPLALLQMIRFLAIVFYHFTKAVWCGEVFPLRPQKKIIDHGEVIGYLDGDKAQSIGRKMALPFILLFAGIKLWDLAGFIFVAVIMVQFLVWFGVIDPPADGFTAIFWVALGCLVLGVMFQLDSIVKRQTIGLRDLIKLFNLNRDPEPVDTIQNLYRHDDTLAVKVKRGTEEFAGKISRKK